MYNQILKELDQAAQEFTFPTFNNVNFPVAAMRIICFKSDSEWIIVFERVAYGVSEGTFLNMLSTFGNKIKTPGLHSVIEIISETKEMPIWSDEMDFVLDESNFEILIYGKRFKFNCTPKDYEDAKLHEHSQMNKGLKFLRIVAYKSAEELFLTPDEVLRKINHEDIPLFLIIDEWNHPDVNKIPPDLPGLNPCFQSLANAIANNKKDLYNCSEYINSKWYEWKEVGIF